jgi:hypothetical protein
MLNSDHIAKLSSDDLWVLREAIVELLVARTKKRLRELDALLSRLALSYKSKRLQRAVRRSARIPAAASPSVSSLRPSGSSIENRRAKSVSRFIKRTAGRSSQ